VIQGVGDNGGGNPRPGWFWEDVQFGGILCDIGSHQIDQFLFYTGSTRAEIVETRPDRRILRTAAGIGGRRVHGIHANGPEARRFDKTKTV
jgi:predicted dehydrogenase